MLIGAPDALDSFILQSDGTRMSISPILVCRESTTCRSVLLVLYLSLLKTRTIVIGLCLIAIRQSWTTHL